MAAAFVLLTAALFATPLAAFETIMATGDTPGIFNGMCGAESGDVPVSAVSPALLLRMAAQLFGHAPAAWLVTVPGWDFDHGEALSPSTRAQLARAAAVWPHVRRQADL